MNLIISEKAPTTKASYWADLTNKQLKILYNNDWTVVKPFQAVTVKDFGAKGDGSTDDTASFKNALELANKVTGLVDIPVGTYLLGSTSTSKALLPFNVSGNVSFVGKGSSTTSIIIKNDVDFLAPTGTTISLGDLAVTYDSGVNFETIFRESYVAACIGVILSSDELGYYLENKQKFSKDNIAPSVDLLVMDDGIGDWYHLERSTNTLDNAPHDALYRAIEYAFKNLNTSIKEFGTSINQSALSKEAIQDFKKILQSLNAQHTTAKDLKSFNKNLLNCLKANQPSLKQNIINYDKLLAQYSPETYYAPVKDAVKFPSCKAATFSNKITKLLSVTISGCSFTNCQSILRLNTNNCDQILLNHSASTAKEIHVTNPRDILNCLPPVKLNSFSFKDNKVTNSVNAIDINTAFENLDIADNTFKKLYGFGLCFGKNVKARQALWLGGKVTNNNFEDIYYQYPYLSTKAMLLYGTRFTVTDNKIKNMVGGNYNETWGIYTKATQTIITSNTVEYLKNEGSYIKPPFDNDGPFHPKASPHLQSFVNPYNYRVFPLDIKGAPKPGGFNIDGFNLIVSDNIVNQDGRGVGVRLYNTGIICERNIVRGARFGIATSGGIDYPLLKTTNEDPIRPIYSLYIKGNKVYTRTPNNKLPSYHLYTNKENQYSYGIELPINSGDTIYVQSNEIRDAIRGIHFVLNYSTQAQQAQGYKKNLASKNFKKLLITGNSIVSNFEGISQEQQKLTPNSYGANFSTAGEDPVIEAIEMIGNIIKGVNYGVILKPKSKFQLVKVCRNTFDSTIKSRLSVAPPLDVTVATDIPSEYIKPSNVRTKECN